MALVWTNEVPRRLVISDTGQDVTRLFPQISYPNWGYLSQPKGDRHDILQVYGPCNAGWRTPGIRAGVASKGCRASGCRNAR